MTDLPAVLPLRALQAFEAVVRLGGVGRAASRLGVTHGAVSRQISLLQRLLGRPLFEGPRSARRVTPEGERLWSEIAPAFSALEGTMVERSGGRRRLAVSCLSTLATRWLIPRLVLFAAEAPDLSVDLTESYAPLDRMLGGVDLAIRMLDAGAAAPEGLEAKPFMDNAVGLIHAPGLTTEEGGFPDGLRRLTSRSHPTAWRDWSGLTGLPTPRLPAGQFDHQQTMIEAAIAGLGPAVTQSALVETDLRNGRLVAPHGFAPDGAVFAAFTRAGDRSAPARRFTDWLERQGRATAESSRGERS